MLSMDNFGEWLLDVLKKKELSQSDLSRLSGLSRGTISNIVSGTRGRGPESVAAIARALKIPEDDVFRAAGLLNTKSNEDPWVKEMAYKLNMIPSGMRSIAGKFIDSMIQGEETTQPKPRNKVSTSKRGV